MIDEVFFSQKLELNPEIIKSNKSYDTILIGSSSLAIEIIYQLAILSNLSEQNILNLYIIDSQAKKFYAKLKKLFTGIEKIPHLNILTIELETESKEFYANEIWMKEDLTSIIIATQNKKKDLEITMNLQKNTLIKAQILSNISLKNKELESIAKLINYLYREIKYNPNLLFTEQNKNEAQKLWLEKASTEDKKSSKMQSLHIDTKLLALGLKKQKSTKSPKELLKINKKIFDKKLGFREIDDQKLQEYAQKFYDSKNHFKPIYFPKKFESLFEKLIRSEHNRWNTYHHLNGWVYSKNKDKKLKYHDCLMPLEKFDKDHLKTTIIFDIYAVVYIPNILASAGIELYIAGE